ncbi:hypothetical protein BT96DRAFT_1012611 [Gymnopus androsaceus JB14]|uniref:Uncharacterized protein n=1 Tax=Gymnopus androsaceus JB14 TaxID=1447944 RepID=A0A6A4IGG3_9AGAR|nr:hypothetical protein BT96DRAFT_1012611 [Gymnopus androsaceus JB14]
MSSPLDSSLTSKQAEIVTLCDNDVQIALKNYSIPRVLFFQTCVVKFNTDADLLNEEVYECFSWNGIHYLVMEKIDLPTVETWISDSDACNEAEEQSRFDMACKAVANVPPISLHSLPSCRRRDWSHRRQVRPDPKLLIAVLRGAPPLVLNIAHEPLVMVQGDINPRNFLIDPETLHVTIIDFGCISILPRSFVSFTLHATRDNFINGIAKSLGWERSENLEALVAATGIYAQMAGKRFGLDERGLPVHVQKA